MALRWIVLLLVGLVAPRGHGQSLPWPHEVSDLPADPAVTWGRLENGLRYAICPNAEPADRVSLRLLVLAGSMHETAQQRGYAHFVEHLAFDGTRRFPGQSLHATLQENGLARGPDVNAHTHADRTIYRLDVPELTPERLRFGLQVLREFADGLTFDPAEVERERGVILVEKRARDNHAQRAHTAFTQFLFAPGPLADPSSLGTEESLRRATADDLRAFYRTWYRADRLVVIAVGPVDPAGTVREIEAQFASLPRPAEPAPSPDPGPLHNPPEFVLGLDPASEVAGAASFLLASVAPATLPDTRAVLDETLLRTVAFDAFNRRLSLLPRRESAYFTHASASHRSGPVYRQALLRIDSSPRHWQLVVERLEQEWRRAQHHGFTVREIEQSRRRVEALMQQAVEAEATRLSEPLADAMVESIADGRVFLAAAELERIARETLARATPETCLAVFRTAWGPGHPRLFASGQFKLRRPEERLAKTFERSTRTRVAPPGDSAPVEFAYRRIGAPGALVARDHVTDLDIHRVQFANGVRVNLKSTAFERGRILLGARFGTGAAGEPPRQPGLRLFVEHGVSLFALGEHDHHELHQLAMSELSSLSFTCGEDAFYVAAISDTDGADHLLHLLAAHFADPGWRREAIEVVHQRVVSQLEDTRRNTGAFLAAHRQALLAGGDLRYRLPTNEQVLRYSVGDFRRWFGPQLANAPLEIGLVGDFDVETMIELASRTVGALPARTGGAAPRAVAFVPVLPPTQTTVPATTRHGAVQLTWPVPLPHNVGTEHQLELLADVLRNRLMQQIRGGLGAIYAVNCQLWRSELNPDNGYLVALLTCDPADVERLSLTTQQIADELARSPLAEAEFERARRPRLQDVPVQLRTNAYWLAAAVATAQTQPELLERPRQRRRDLEQATAADLDALAARVLPAARASLFTAVPATGE